MRKRKFRVQPVKFTSWVHIPRIRTEGGCQIGRFDISVVAAKSPVFRVVEGKETLTRTLLVFQILV